MNDLLPDGLVASYGFELPPERIAQQPTADRSGSRLLVAGRRSGSAEHRTVAELPMLLGSGDLLVVNDTRVRAARLWGRRATGGRVELLLVRPLEDGSWSALVRPSARIREDSLVTLLRRRDSAEGPQLRIGRSLPGGQRQVWGVDDGTFDHWGEMPLPPYIDRSTGPESHDSERYQTVFAEHDGAVAAPTAGLHFTPELLGELDSAGVDRASVTLHVGLGTFAPLRVERLADVELHSERWEVPVATARAIEACEARGGRLVLVGTTSLRTLESWHRLGRPDDGQQRSTSLFLHPGDPPRLEASLLTNFHLPRSSLLMLVAAVCGRSRTLELYDEAMRSDYRFYSYGDAMLLL